MSKPPRSIAAEVAYRGFLVAGAAVAGSFRSAENDELDEEEKPGGEKEGTKVTDVREGVESKDGKEQDRADRG